MSFKTLHGIPVEVAQQQFSQKMVTMSVEDFRFVYSLAVGRVAKLGTQRNNAKKLVGIAEKAFATAR